MGIVIRASQLSPFLAGPWIVPGHPVSWGGCSWPELIFINRWKGGRFPRRAASSARWDTARTSRGAKSAWMVGWSGLDVRARTVPLGPAAVAAWVMSVAA